jgi:hypothetical protein
MVDCSEFYETMEQLQKAARSMGTALLDLQLSFHKMFEDRYKGWDKRKIRRYRRRERLIKLKIKLGKI